MSAFDSLAADYDEVFTDTALGRQLRSIVWSRLDRFVHPGARVLDLGCGTGEDAVHWAQRGAEVVATDASATMVEVTRAKAHRHRFGEQIEARHLTIERLDELVGSSPFDVVVSNFGAMNCVGDIGDAGRRIAAQLRPGGAMALCVMGPVVPWEWMLAVAQRRPSDASRRLRRGGSVWREVTIRYPSVRTTRRAVAPWFAVRSVGPVGIALPPSEGAEWFGRHARTARALTGAERVLGHLPGTASLSDHYLLIAERR